ncbi:MAG: Cell wall-binding protein YocH precursor [Firmicutes bacterium ADurb.Bin456]|nr:MAG: Cell wall-binding protein YocH precursor [Firmicutes bacterium ADurb.Bin456]
MSWSRLLDWVKRDNHKNSEEPRPRGVLFLWAATLAVVALFAICGYAWAKKTVVLVVDGKETTVQAFSATVGGVLEKQGIPVQEKDEVIPVPETPLKDRMVITINRAVNLSVRVDGNTIAARTRGGTVGDVLNEYGICLEAEDEVAPAREAPVVADMEICVDRVRTVTEVCEVPLDFETQRKYTINMPQGSTRVAQEGRAGTKRQTWQVVYKNDREFSRQLASQEVVRTPVDRVIMVGSGAVVSRGGEEIRYSEAREMVATGYTHTGYNTASGVYPHYGVAAVDTSNVSLGTKMYVEGYGYATARDRGSAIKGNRIDLFFETRQEAMSWGVRRVKVYFLD